MDHTVAQRVVGVVWSAHPVGLSVVVECIGCKDLLGQRVVFESLGYNRILFDRVQDGRPGSRFLYHTRLPLYSHPLLLTPSFQFGECYSESSLAVGFFH